jgi:hypothetical protein
MTMKTLKIFAASLLAVASLSVASATTLKITGSTAFRKAMYSSVYAQLAGGGTVQAFYVGSSLAGANQATFTNGTDVVQCCMAGSVGGVNWIVNDTPAATAPGANTSQAWVGLASNAANLTNGSTGWATVGLDGSNAVTGGTASGSGTGTVAAVAWDAASKADISMSDSYQGSTPYSPALTGTTLADVGGGVGVVTFVWAKGQQPANVSSAAYARLTNVTLLGSQNLLANGIAPLSMFTGNSADATTDVVLVGRDNDSGTRLGTFAETGFGGVDSSAVQYKAYATADQSIDVGITSGTLTIDHVTVVGPLAGYPSGGQVKKVLQSAFAGSPLDDNGNPFILVAYLGTGDTPGSSLELTYNGVNTNNAGNVAYGAATFWTLEHMLYKSTLASAQKTIANGIATQMTNTYAPLSGLLLGSLHVSRGVEGGVVSPN